MRRILRYDNMCDIWMRADFTEMFGTIDVFMLTVDTQHLLELEHTLVCKECKMKNIHVITHTWAEVEC